MVKLSSVYISFGILLMMHAVYSMIEFKQYSGNVDILPKDIIVEAILGGFLALWTYAPSSSTLRKIKANEHFHDKLYDEMHQRPNFRNFHNSRCTLISQRAALDLPDPE